MAAKKSGSPSLSLAAFVSLLNAVIQGINSNMQSSKAVVVDTVSTTWAGVVQVFQTFITDYGAAVTAKQAVKTAVASQTTSKKAAEAMLKAVTALLVNQFGQAAYSMFGLPQPKPKAIRSAANKAVSSAKGTATKSQKKAAVLAITGTSNDEASTSLVASAVAATPAAAPVPAAAPAPAKQ